MFWRFLCLLQFYCLLALYTYLGLTPNPETSIPVFNDLLMHFAGYIVAGASISFARPLLPLWQRALLLIAFSFTIEIAQHFNPPRTFSWSDMLANSGGIILGLAIVWVLQISLPT
jgi:VanZ family protein